MPEALNDTGQRILLIEDEPAVARLTEIVLNGAGYPVQVVADHALASDLLAESAYRLVIADTDLGPHTPGLAGLAPLVAAAHCPVLLFSAHRFPAAEIAAAGFAGVISKPYDIDDLLRIVEQTIARGPSDSPSGTVTALH